MAAPRLTLLVVALLAAITLCEGLRGAGPKKCCFRFNEKPVASDKVLGYVKTSQRCSKPAVLLTTKAGQLCVRPSATWVKELISSLEAKYLLGERANA